MPKLKYREPINKTFSVKTTNSRLEKLDEIAEKMKITRNELINKFIVDGINLCIL